MHMDSGKNKCKDSFEYRSGAVIIFIQLKISNSFQVKIKFFFSFTTYYFLIEREFYTIQLKNIPKYLKTYFYLRMFPVMFVTTRLVFVINLFM